MPCGFGYDLTGPCTNEHVPKNAVTFDTGLVDQGSTRNGALFPCSRTKRLQWIAP